MNRENRNDSDWEFEDNEESDLFDKAAQEIQKTHDKLQPDDLLKLYGLYKQATEGKCNITQPSIFNMRSRAKWCAWNDLRDMPSNTAKDLYVEKVKQLHPKWFENINNCKSAAGGTGWVVHSIELPPNDHNPKPDHEKNIFDILKDKDISLMKKKLKNTDFLLLDENGMGLIHWASDANDVNILEFLLLSGCPVDLRDSEQQTALHYASSCGHLECVKLLLQFNADKSIQDSNGQTCIDVAYDAKTHSLLLEV